MIYRDLKYSKIMYSYKANMFIMFKDINAKLENFCRELEKVFFKKTL